MGEVIRIKKVNNEGKENLVSSKKHNPEDYNLVLRHFQGLMLDKYHQDFRRNK